MLERPGSRAHQQEFAGMKYQAPDHTCRGSQAQQGVVGLFPEQLGPSTA